MSAASTSSNMGGAAQDMTTNPAWPQKQSHSLRPSTAPVRRSRAVSSRQINYAMPPASEAGSEPDGGPQGEGGEGAAPANKKPKVWSRMRSQAPDHQKWKESVSKVPGSEYYNRNAYELSSADMARYHQLAINVDQGGPHIPGAYSRPLSAGGLGKTTGQLGGGPGMIGQGASLAATMPGGQHVTDRPASAYHRLEQTQTGEFRPPVARPEERAPVDGHGHLISRGRSRGNYTNEVFGDQLGLPGGTAELRGAGRAAQMRTRGGGANLNNTLGSGSGGELLDEQDLALVRGDATLKSRLAVHEQEDDPAALMESYTKRKKEQYLGTTGTDFDETTGEKIKLPFGWTKHRAKVEGERKSYYYNRFTGESKWERPTGVAVGDLMQTDVEKTRKEEMNEEQRQAEMRRVAAIEANVTEGDGLHDVDENLPDIVLFFIIIYRYLRTNYRRLKKQLKKAFEKQADEEVMAILMRENEAFTLTHMGVGVDMVEYVEPLEAPRIVGPAALHLTLPDTENTTLMTRLPRLGDGFEHFRNWILEVGKSTHDLDGEAWIRAQWERLNYQVEEEERDRNPGRTYSLEQLQSDYGREHYKVLERELRQRIFDLSANKTSAYEKLAVRQRTGAEQDMARIKETLQRLAKEKADLNKKRTEKEEQLKVLAKTDANYNTQHIMGGVAPPSSSSATSGVGPSGAPPPSPKKQGPPPGVSTAGSSGEAGRGSQSPKKAVSGAQKTAAGKKSPKKKPG